MIIKVCGITCADDARMALDAGVDWLGLNLVAGPRRIELPVAEAIATSLDDAARVVALIGASADALPEETLDRLATAGVRSVQVYVRVAGGSEETSECLRQLAARGFETIAVQPIVDEASFAGMATVLATCGDRPPRYVLFDAAATGKLGGTGRTADWSLIAGAIRRGTLDGWPPILLAGGLNPSNVREAIRSVMPAGVDVCSGVESTPGRKDPEKLHALVAAVRRVD